MQYLLYPKSRTVNAFGQEIYFYHNAIAVISQRTINKQAISSILELGVPLTDLSITASPAAQFLQE